MKYSKWVKITQMNIIFWDDILFSSELASILYLSYNLEQTFYLNLKRDFSLNLPVEKYIFELK